MIRNDANQQAFVSNVNCSKVHYSQQTAMKKFQAQIFIGYCFWVECFALKYLLEN